MRGSNVCGSHASCQIPKLRAPPRARSPLALLGLIDSQWSPTHVLAIEILDSSRSVRSRHFDEAKAAWSSSIPIDDHTY
jgi:hypothetical protein